MSNNKIIYSDIMVEFDGEKCEADGFTKMVNDNTKKIIHYFLPRLITLNMCSKLDNLQVGQVIRLTYSNDYTGEYVYIGSDGDKLRFVLKGGINHE